MYGWHVYGLFTLENAIIMYLSIVLDIVLGESSFKIISKFLVLYQFGIRIWDPIWLIEVIYRVYNWQLGLNFVARLAADKNIYLQLTFQKMLAFVVFTKKYLQPYSCRELELRLCDLWNTNQFQSHEPKLPFFTNCFFQNMITLKYPAQ